MPRPMRRYKINTAKKPLPNHHRGIYIQIWGDGTPLYARCQWDENYLAWAISAYGYSNNAQAEIAAKKLQSLGVTCHAFTMGRVKFVIIDDREG